MEEGVINDKVTRFNALSANYDNLLTNVNHIE